MRKLLLLCLIGLALVALGTPAFAMGPVDGEVGTYWWASEAAVDSDGLAAVGSTAPGLRGELWLFNRYGVHADLYKTELDDLAGTKNDFMSVDLLWRAFAPSENNYLAVGLGWQQSDLYGNGLDAETGGMRMSLQGKVSILSQLQAYGMASYLPSMDDATDSFGVQIQDLKGTQYELGMSWRFLPAFSLVGGYRLNSVDFRSTDPATFALLESPPSTDSAMDMPLVGSAPQDGGLVELQLDIQIEDRDDGCNCLAAASSTTATADNSGFFLGVNFSF